MYRHLTAFKGEPRFGRGIWVGKSPWTDCHIVLTPGGAVESRTVKRIPDQFIGTDLVIVKGLPWNYSVCGVLMKKTGPRKRTAVAADEAEEGEKIELDKAEEQIEEKKAKEASAERQAREAGMAEAEEEESARRAKAMRRSEEAAFHGARRLSGEESPAKRRGVDEFSINEITVMPHGDSNAWDEIENIGELDMNDWGPEDPDGLETVDDEMQVMDFDQEEVQRMDAKAEEEEISRLKAMPALIELQPHEENDYNDITTKMVITWKKREEKGGWFRRARLVARQFRWSIDVEDSFAPTSLMAIPRMLLHLAACCPEHYGVQVIDVKDAFLMVPQPEDERASVTYRGKRYKLVRCLPGQRTAANRWYIHFRDAAREFGMVDDVMQPTLMKLDRELYISLHVDDLLMVGTEEKRREFMEFLHDEVQGPFDIGECFEYLKRKIDRTYEGFVIRPDPKHIEDIAQKADIKIGNYKKTPARSDLGKRDGSAEPSEVETSKFRSIVGKMLYIGGERPDCQHAINALASWMSKPTKTAWRHAEHLASYLVATEFYGLLIKSSRCGKSMLDMREMQDVEVKKVHLLEVVTDSDYAGDQNSRKSITSFQVFLDGNLMESRVRSQKSISLSSGESEYGTHTGPGVQIR
ncbi:unnamed protein product [Effrenium voratum]|nr:unnamed protein product [Effrenium voratum]